MQDIYQLYLFALVVHLVILIPYYIMADHHRQTGRGVVKKILDLALYAAPPGIPTLMIANGVIGSMMLAKEGLTLIYPEYLQHAADLSIACFDKTGTLTHRSVSACHLLFL